MSNYEVDINETSTKVLQDKIKKMIDRNEQRKNNDMKRRRERFEFGCQAEQAEVFTETFKQHKHKIEDELEAAMNASFAGENRSELSIRLDNVIKIIEALKKYLTESSMFLTSFDNEQAKNDFQDIMSKFNKIRDNLLPQKKFGFGSRTKKTFTKQNEEVKEISVKPHTVSMQQKFGFMDRSDEILTICPDELNGKDVILSNLERCEIQMLGSPGSIYMRDIRECRILCGPIARSILIENCTNSQLYFAAQQARIHCTHNTAFYVHVTSQAIIEHCTQLVFAPYLMQYKQLPEHYQLAQLDCQINNWDKVEDFRHLSKDVASPNWSIIPEQERVPVEL